MSTRRHLRGAVRWLGFAGGAAAAGYATYAGVTWCRYGHPEPATGDDQDPLLDRFMPSYDVVERHRIRIGAPADITFDAATTMELFQSPLIRAIFKGRALILGAARAERPSRGLLAEVQALGWVVLAEIPGREIVVGAVTRPWEPNVIFRSLAPEAFLAFAESDYVKIAWTLRADPVGAGDSVFRTETRALATDPAARGKFRRYWALLSPGIIAIRWLSSAPLRAAAERRADQEVAAWRARHKAGV
ncbi:MAG: hypothetical protein ABI868_24870 [Acidobacteriota bacterium]